MHRPIVAISIALVLALAAPVLALEPVDINPAIAAKIDVALEAATGTTSGQTPALSVAVLEHGKIVYARAFGVSDLATKSQATPHTRFRIASLTKMFTAVSIMQLVEAQRIKLDAPLAAYLPDAPHASEVTIRQLLMHTSGIWNYGDAAFTNPHVTEPILPGAIVASTASHPLDHLPGASFSYSNTGYVLLGMVVESITHRRLADYERERIFLPAKMNETTCGDPEGAVDFARGYMDATGAVPPAYSPSWFFADGDIVSTASDIARFDAALLDGRLIKPATFSEMQSSAGSAPMLGNGVMYGLGLMLVSMSGMTLVGHHGGVPGFVAQNDMVPASGFAIVVLSDAYDFATANASHAVVRQTFPALFASSPNPPLAAVEDPSVTAKLRGFLQSVQRGTIDRMTLTAAMNDALTPAALTGLAKALEPLASPPPLVVRSTQSLAGFTAFQYEATFTNGRKSTITFSLDTTGKIAGFFLSK